LRADVSSSHDSNAKRASSMISSHRRVIASSSSPLSIREGSSAFFFAKTPVARADEPVRRV
jgi:hypothetical protein